MTRQQLAVQLTEHEGGTHQVNVAQMNQVLKALKGILEGPQGMAALKAILKDGIVAALVLVLATGCAMIPADFTAPLDKMIKDHGAGEYWVACQGGKDDRQLAGVKGAVDCTASTTQLTGCHPKSIAFEGPK